MTSRTLRMTGIAGLVWGVLTLIAYLAAFFLVGRALAGEPGPGAGILEVLNTLSAAALVSMLLLLSGRMVDAMAKTACYAAVAVVALATVLTLADVAAPPLPRIVSILAGLALAAVGAFAVMQEGGRAWQAFAILLIVAGALKAIVVGEIIYPVVACAAGIVLLVAMNGAAKQAT